MKFLRTQLVSIVMLLAPPSMAHDHDGPKQAACNAMELWGIPPHDELVCAGVASMNAGRYRDATESFEQAVSMSFYHDPNVFLFSRLALAYFRAGDVAMAKVNLRKAELALSVLSEVISCVDVDGGRDAVLQHRRSGNIPTKDEERYIIGRMCGSVISGGYGFHSLEEVVGRAAFVQQYFDVRDIVLAGGELVAEESAADASGGRQGTH